MNKKKIAALSLVLLVALTACSAPNAEVTPSPAPAQTESPATPAPTTAPDAATGVNALTGMPIDESSVHKRPIAVMLNNIKKALPQLGNSQADIIYEVLAEGGITRMLGVYQSVENVGMIGSVRSSRPYYLELALGHDAVYLHAGGSEDAYAKIKAWNVTALDCVRGPYEGSLFWRDEARRKNNGQEHSVVTSGDKILELFPTYSFRQEHEEGYTYPIHFKDDGTPQGGETANTVTVPFSSYKTGVFKYDAESKQYLVEEYGNAYIDGNTGEQVAVTNVLIIKTACNVIRGDDAGRITVDLTSGGEGYFACGGRAIPIKWSKADRNSPIVYTALDGTDIELGRGTSYVNIVPLNANITFG